MKKIEYDDRIIFEHQSSSIELKIINKWVCEIEHLRVPFEKRKNGIGTLLLRELEKEANQRKLKKLSLLCRVDNEPALNLYWKENYKIEGILKNHFENGIDIYILSKFVGEKN